MTTQAAVSVLRRWASIVVDSIVWLGLVSVLLLLTMTLIMPLGHMVFDYWTPKVQGLLQPTQPAAKILKGGR